MWFGIFCAHMSSVKKSYDNVSKHSFSKCIYPEKYYIVGRCSTIWRFEHNNEDYAGWLNFSFKKTTDVANRIEDVQFQKL